MKISIIGAGKVGSATAFSILHLVKPRKLVLIDVVEPLVKSEALDLGHAAVVLSPQTRVVGTTNISEIAGSDFIVVAAGNPRIAKEPRKCLAKANSQIIKKLCAKISEFAPDAKVAIVTNPSTQMAEVAKQSCNNRIIAMDNQLDTARLKYYISREIGKPVNRIQSRVYGEHGKNMQFSINDKLTQEQIAKVKELTRRAGEQILLGKGHTCWGIAVQVANEILNFAENN